MAKGTLWLTIVITFDLVNADSMKVAQERPVAPETPPVSPWRKALAIAVLPIVSIVSSCSTPQPAKAESDPQDRNPAPTSRENPSQKSEPRSIAESIANFQALVGEIKAAGLTFTPLPGISSTEAGDPLDASDCIFIGNKLLTKTDADSIKVFSKLFGRLLDDGLRAQLDNIRSLAPELRHSQMEFASPVLVVTSEVLESNLARITLYNFINGYSQNFIIPLEVVTSRHQDEMRPALTSFARVFDEEYRRQVESFDNDLANIPPRPDLVNKWLPYVTTDVSRTIDSVSLDQLRQAISGSEITTSRVGKARESFGLRLNITPGIAECDRDVEDVVLDAEMLAGMNGHPLAIEGTCNTILIRRVVEAKAAGIKWEPKNEKDDGPYNETYTDKFGNLVSRTWIKHRKSDQLTVTLRFHIPMSFSADQTNTLSAVNLDLGGIGLGTIENCIFQKTLCPILANGPYHFYSNLAPDAAEALLRPHVKSIVEEAKRLEELFGFQPGDRLRQFYIPNSKYANASFANKNPSTVTLQEERLSRDSPEELAIVVTHEIFHLLDHVLKISDTVLWDFFEKEFKLTYFEFLGSKIERENGKALEAISERNFRTLLRGRDKKAGHPVDNCYEALASNLNACLDPDYEKRLSELSYEALRAHSIILRMILIGLNRAVDSGDLPAHAKIIPFLKDCLAMVATHISKHENNDQAIDETLFKFRGPTIER